MNDANRISGSNPPGHDVHALPALSDEHSSASTARSSSTEQASSPELSGLSPRTARTTFRRLLPGGMGRKKSESADLASTLVGKTHALTALRPDDRISPFWTVLLQMSKFSNDDVVAPMKSLASHIHQLPGHAIQEPFELMLGHAKMAFSEKTLSENGYVEIVNALAQASPVLPAPPTLPARYREHAAHSLLDGINDLSPRGRSFILTNFAKTLPDQPFHDRAAIFSIILDHAINKDFRSPRKAEAFHKPSTSTRSLSTAFNRDNHKNTQPSCAAETLSSLADAISHIPNENRYPAFKKILDAGKNLPENEQRKVFLALSRQITYLDFKSQSSALQDILDTKTFLPSNIARNYSIDLHETLDQLTVIASSLPDTPRISAFKSLMPRIWESPPEKARAFFKKWKINSTPSQSISRITLNLSLKI